VLGPDIEVRAVQPPGRLERFREPALTDVRAIAAEVASALAELDPLPYVVFGDCMGALVAYELVMVLRSRGLPLPAALVVGFYQPPDQLRTREPFADAPPAALRQRLREVGGVPPEVLADDELFELLLPVIRADFAAFEDYVHTPTEPLDLELVALVGREDPYVDESDVAGWARHTRGPFRVHTLDGDHFLLRHNDAAVRVVGQLAAAAVPTGRPPSADAG